jgi:iron complex outermembrane receptor protein
LYGLAGVYTLYNSSFGWGVFPGLELGYTLGENTKLFFNTGTAQRIPSFTDLYYRGPSNISNPNLQPENSRSGELGFRSVRSKGMIQATVFLRQINGMVDWVKDSIQKPWSPVNYNATRTPGIDINGNIHILQRQGLFLSLYAGYTYLQQGFVNEVAKTYSKNILENLKHQALLQARLRIGEHFNMNAGVRYIQRETMAAYTLCDLHLQYAFKRFSVYTNINNITNIQFREIAAVPMPPRWISLGLRYDLN